MKNMCVMVLQDLPEAIEEAENELVEVNAELFSAKDLLADKEAELLVNGKIDGKNAEIRAAQMRGATKQEREAVTLFESDVARAKVKLNVVLNKFKAYLAIAGLLREVA